MIPAMELPALPTPAPGTAAPHTTPRLQAGTPWCADPNDHEDQPLSASTGASAFMTEPPADAPPPAARPASGGAKSVTRGRGKKAAANRAAVLQMLHQAKRQAAEEEAHEGVETVEDVLHEAKQRQHEILVRAVPHAAYDAVQTTRAPHRTCSPQQHRQRTRPRAKRSSPTWRATCTRTSAA